MVTGAGREEYDGFVVVLRVTEAWALAMEMQQRAAIWRFTLTHLLGGSWVAGDVDLAVPGVVPSN